MKRINSELKLNLNDNLLNKNESEKESSTKLTYDISESLLKHKVFLEKILQIIKIYQIDYLSQISFNSKNIKNNGVNNSPTKTIKKILINLKNELMTTLKDNTESKANLQQLMNNNKSILVKSIFDFERENVNNLKVQSDKKVKKIKKIKDDNDYKYNIELPHLKLLNFKIENLLKYLNIMIKLKTDSKKYYIFCDNQNIIQEASNYLHDNWINIRNEFKSIVKKKEIQNRNLIILNSKVRIMREEVELLGKKSSNDYINTSEIINEDSREYYKKTNICTMENLQNLNNEFEDNNYIKKNLKRVNDCN